MDNWKNTRFAFATRSLVFADQMNNVIAKTKQKLADADVVGEVLEENLVAGGGGLLWYMKYVPKDAMTEADSVLGGSKPAAKSRKK